MTAAPAARAEGAGLDAATATLPTRVPAWPLLPLGMLAVVVFLWSSNNIASKLMLRDMTPGLLYLVRSTIAVAIFHLPVF